MKILLCNEAYIGDLILSTAILPALKSAKPDCKIGFLAGSWAKDVVEDHKFIDWVHIHDQVRMDRGALPKREKKRREIQSRKKSISQVSEIQYDIAIDLHSFFNVNSAYFLFRAQIPERVGFRFCHQHFFYTQTLFWPCDKYHTLENHKIMLSLLEMEERHLENFLPCLEYKKPIIYSQFPEKYIVVHPAAGNPTKEWENASWEKLVFKLDKLGIPLIFIGKGNRENERICALTKSLSRAHNLCNKVRWKELIPIIKNAQFLIGMDSMAGHMAAHFGIPALLIYTEQRVVADWRPYHPYCHVIKPDPKYWRAHKELYPKKPIDMIDPEDVFEKARKILKSHAII